MSETKGDGGPAFPNEGFNGWGEPQAGMTLRDYFAAKALGGIVGAGDLAGEWIGFNEAGDYTGMARHAYLIADAMLAERSKP